VRQFYDLEGLWTDARRLKIPAARKPRAGGERGLRPGPPNE
jgi:hypothetical protein